MYIKTIESVLTFNILIVFYFYWLVIYFQAKASRTTILTLSALALIISISLSYFFLLNVGRKKTKLIISKNRKTYLMFFAISAHSLVIFIAFFLKPGGSQLIPIEIFCSLFAAIFVFLHPLKRKNAILILNICILIVQIIVLYKITYNIINYNYYNIVPFFASTGTLAFFAIISFAFSLLSSISLSNKLFKYKSLLLFIFLNIMVSILIIILSYSRGALVSFVIMFVYLLCSALFFKKSEASSILKLLIISMAILALPFLLNKPLNLKFLNYFYSLYKFRISFFETPRYEIWKDVIGQITTRTDTFLFGEPILFLEITNTHQWHAHNSYLEMIRCAGIFSLFFFFIGVYIAFSKKGFGFFKENILATAVLIVLLIQIFFQDIFMSGNYYFLIFWAMLECCRTMNLKNNKKIN